MSTLSEFRRDLEKLVNYHSMENGSDTPDFMLAEYLTNCLTAFNAAVMQRETWYGKPSDPEPDNSASRNFWLGAITGASLVVILTLGPTLAVFAYALMSLAT